MQPLVRIEKGLALYSQLSEERPKVEEIKSLARLIQQKYATSEAAHKAQAQNDDVLAHACLYLRDVLSFLEFEMPSLMETRDECSWY